MPHSFSSVAAFVILVFQCREIFEICKEALTQGPLTRQLALKVMAAKGIDTGEKVLAKAVAGRPFMRCASNADAGLSTGQRNIWARGFGCCRRINRRR
jgi:hypothetical protein